MYRARYTHCVMMCRIAASRDTGCDRGVISNYTWESHSLYFQGVRVTGRVNRYQYKGVNRAGLNGGLLDDSLPGLACCKSVRGASAAPSPRSLDDATRLQC